MKAFRKWKLIVHSYFEKGCRKKGTRQCIVGGFEFTVLEMAREAIDVCLWVLKESNNRRFDSYSVRNSLLIMSHITFRDCRVHIFSDNLSWNSCIWVNIATVSYTRPSWRCVQSLYEEGSTVDQAPQGHFGALKRTLLNYQNEWIDG